MTPSFWSNVQVAIQSALSTAVTIDAISKANPGLIEYTDAGASDPANGAYVLLSVNGMHQLDQRVVRVANVDTVADDFESEGVDTTSFDTFSSGTFQVITFGTTLSSAVGINASGGDYETADITTIHDSTRKVVPTVASPLTYTFDCLWDPSDTALAALKAASDAKSTRAVKFTFSDGRIFVFNGYVGASLAPTGGAQEAVRTSVTITAYGRPTAYSS